MNLLLSLIFFCRPGKSFDKLMPEIQNTINNILEKDYVAS